MRPQAAPDWFNPGRGVNQSCLDYGEGLDRPDYVVGCIIIPGDAVNQPVLINQTEYVQTVGNLSDLNQVYLGFHEGLQYSVLGPAHIPENLDFQATSYGSHTECRMVTTQCGAESAYGDRDEPPSVFNFVCNNTMAGLNMTGNFASLGQQSEGYGYGQNASSQLPKNISTEMIIENVNTLSTSNFDFGFQYFNDSAKQEQVPRTDNYGLGAVEYGPVTNTTNQYFWAFAFNLDIQLDIGDATQNPNPWGYLNLVSSAQGGAEGIMSCQTNISEIVRLTEYAITSPIPFPPAHTNFPTSLFRPTACLNPPFSSPLHPHPALMPQFPSSTVSRVPGAMRNSIKASNNPSYAPKRQKTSHPFSLQFTIKH